MKYKIDIKGFIIVDAENEDKAESKALSDILTQEFHFNIVNIDIIKEDYNFSEYMENHWREKK